MSGKSLNIPKNPMFIHSKKPLSKNDIKAHKEEGELFLAVRLMESDKLNEAAERLSKLSSPYGSYYLALVSLFLLCFVLIGFSQIKYLILSILNANILTKVSNLYIC